MTCYFAGKGGFSCIAPVDPHHIIKRQTIRGQVSRGAWLEDYAHILHDSRNIIPVCRQHHANWHNARFTVARSELPESVEQFAAEYGLTWALDREYGQRSEAA